MGDAAGPLRHTPLFEEHVRLNARMVPFGGWEMPVDYGSQIEEHHAVRNGVGIFDVSHMGQARLLGPRVHEFLAVLVPGNTRRLQDGGSIYTTLCTKSGGVVDDLIITRLGEGEAFAVINAATAEADLAWMREQRARLGFEDVQIVDECDRWGMIAVQGPEALALIETLVPGVKWTETRAFTMHPLEVDGELTYISRTGYTGENGVEVICPAGRTAGWWRKLLAAGAKPAGLGARDSLRLEVGYPLYGQDLSTTISPYEGGIGWTVSLKKPDAFIGRAVLEEQKANGAPRASVGLRLDSRRPIRHGDPISDGSQVIGEVTSGGFSPTLGVGIALALVDRAAAAGRETLFVVKGGKLLEAAVQKPPFVQVKSQPVK